MVLWFRIRNEIRKPCFRAAMWFAWVEMQVKWNEGLERGYCTGCRAHHGREQLDATKDSRKVEKNCGAVQKCYKPLSVLFPRKLFQVIQCSQGEAAQCVLDLAKPSVSQLLSAWGNQKGRRLGGGMAPPRASAHHILNWRKGRWSMLRLHFELTQPAQHMRCELIWGATEGPF